MRPDPTALPEAWRYRHSDHEAIATLVAQIDQNWIVSYDNVPEVRRLYRSYRQQTFGLRYSAQARYEGIEIMIFCDDLKTPGPIEPFRGIAV